MPDRIDALTGRQRECLRLVARGYSTKEIALALGISPDTARTHLDAARARLGAADRRAAARLLSSHETSIEAPPSAASRSTGMADEADRKHPDPVSGDGGMVGTTLHAPAASTYVATSRPGAGMRWPFSTAGRPFNDLAWWEQTAWAIAIAIGSVVAIHEAASLLSG